MFINDWLGASLGKARIHTGAGLNAGVPANGKWASGEFADSDRMVGDSIPSFGPVAISSSIWEGAACVAFIWLFADGLPGAFFRLRAGAALLSQKL